MTEVYVAIDTHSKIEATERAKLIKNCNFKGYKLGLEYILTEGIITAKEIGIYNNKQLFIDVKLHDIKTTVVRTLNSLDNYITDYISIHSTCGYDTLLKANFIMKESKLAAVTKLTSHNTTEKEILQLTLAPYSAGINTFICSPMYVPLLKKEYNHIKCICPGIRIEQNKAEHIYSYTPKQAQDLGADYIVVGREIFNSSSPVDKLNQILDQLN